MSGRRGWTCSVLALALALLCGARPVRAQQPPQQEPEFAAFLFAPELIMQHQGRLGLTARQRTDITEAIQGLQSEVLAVQWQMQEATHRLSELLRPASADAVAALAQVDRVLELERTIKRAHMGALIRIKNTLTPEQQRLLADLRDGAATRDTNEE